MSSAAMVDGRIRLSAKARSSGTVGFRWWQTMSMSRCSSRVLTVCGRVGFVELGRTFGAAATVMMSGAWPPPAPSVWYAWMARPAIAARVSSTKPASLSVSECSATCTPAASATRRQASIAAGVDPQSSCSLKPAAPPRSCSHSAASPTVLPLPSRTTFTGSVSIADSIRARFHGPGVTVVALVPSAGPVPPPISVVMPTPRASGTCCGQIRCTWQSTAPAVRIFPFPARISVPGPITRSGWTPSMVSGLPALPSATIRPSRMPMSALTTPQWSSTTAPVMTRSGVPSARDARACPMDSRITLPPPNTASSPVSAPAGPRLRSSVTSMNRSVSASRMRSPTVGPYRSE